MDDSVSLAHRRVLADCRPCGHYPDASSACMCQFAPGKCGWSQFASMHVTMHVFPTARGCILPPLAGNGSQISGIPQIPALARLAIGVCKAHSGSVRDCVCLHVTVRLLGEQRIVGSRLWNLISVLISQPGIVERKIPIASPRLWDPPSAVTMATTGMTKYHRSDATLCLHTASSFTRLCLQRGTARQLDRADNLPPYRFFLFPSSSSSPSPG